jgi:hypothetical protein
MVILKWILRMQFFGVYRPRDNRGTTYIIGGPLPWPPRSPDFSYGLREKCLLSASCIKQQESTEDSDSGAMKKLDYPLLIMF